jgi:hypothetical protein
MTADHRAHRSLLGLGRSPIAGAFVVCVCLVSSGCGGSSASVASIATTAAAPTTSTGTSTTAGTPAAQVQDLLAFSGCMRKHGVSSFPDPTRNADGSYGFAANLGQLRKLIRSSQNALTSCESLLAQSGILSSANIGKFRQQMLAYARCMRSHGVADFPDPNANGRFEGQLKSLDRNTPTFQAAVTACRAVLSKAIGAFTVGGVGG